MAIWVWLVLSIFRTEFISSPHQESGVTITSRAGPPVVARPTFPACTASALGLVTASMSESEAKAAAKLRWGQNWKVITLWHGGARYSTRCIEYWIVDPKDGGTFCDDRGSFRRGYNKAVIDDCNRLGGH